MAVSSMHQPEDDHLIVRVMEGYAEANHAGSLWGLLAERLARAEVPEGRLSATFGRQVHGDGSESFVYVTTWQDMESIYAWVSGPDLVETPALLRGLESLIDGYDVQHYIVPDLRGTMEPRPGTERLEDEVERVRSSERNAVAATAGRSSAGS